MMKKTGGRADNARSPVFRYKEKMPSVAPTARPSHGYKETMPSDAPTARASSFDFANFVAKRPRRPGASMRLSALRAALSWIFNVVVCVFIAPLFNKF